MQRLEGDVVDDFGIACVCDQSNHGGRAHCDCISLCFHLFAGFALGFPQCGMKSRFVNNVNGCKVKAKPVAQQAYGAAEDRVQIECGSYQAADFGGGCQLGVAALQRLFGQLAFGDILMDREKANGCAGFIQDGAVCACNGNQAPILAFIYYFPCDGAA